jgi:poly(A) polymerase
MLEQTQQAWAGEVLDLAARLAEGVAVPSHERTTELRVVAGADELGGEWMIPTLDTILMGDQVEAALQWLQEVGFLARALPEVEATVDFTQEVGRRHKDVWKHTKQVVAQAAREQAVRWAALLHDIGKVPTRVLLPDGKVTFHGHAEAGARLFDRISRRLGLPKPLRSTVRFLILHHLRANQYDGAWTDSAVRRFDREMGEHLPSLLQLSRADITSAQRHRRESALQQIEELWERVRALRELDARVPPLPSGLGNEIMQRFGLQPGRHIGDLRRELERAIEAGELEPHHDAEYYLAHLATSAAAAALLAAGRSEG